MKNNINTLQDFYPNRVLSPKSTEDIPENTYMTYVLFYNSNPIVLGHGKKNRSKVIFDNLSQITSGHLKALFVRLYVLFGNGELNRFIITAETKEEAIKIESNLHKQIGGNHRMLPEEIREQLFKGIDPNSLSHLVLEIALRSSFDGISDIRKWRNDGLLNDEVWQVISSKLQLP